MSAVVRISPSFKSASSAGFHVSVSFSCGAEMKGPARMDQDAARVISETIFGSEGEVDESGAKMGDIVALSGDPKMVIRWISGKVKKSAGALESMYAR
jgi:hypothetical protein